MGKYNVIPTFIAGQAARRAEDESNYIAARRKTTDAREDKDYQLSDEARASRIARHGIEAYDPVSYGQMQGIEQRQDLHPIAVDQAGETLRGTQLQNEGTAADNQFTVGERERAAAGRMLAGLANSGAKTPEEALAFFNSVPPELLAASGTDPTKIPQLLEQLSQFPDIQTGVRALRHAMGTPERVSQIVSGLGPDGKPVNMALGEDQAPGALSVTPDDRMHGLEVEQAKANIDATRALTTDRLRGPAGKAGDLTPAEAEAQAQAVFDTIADMRTQLNSALQAGAITSGETDGITNLMTGDNPVGRFIGGLTGDQKEVMRRTIDDTTTQLLIGIINSPGMSSRLFDTEGEKKMWRDMLGAGGSYENRWEAIEKFERWAQARLSDPSRIGRTATPGAQAPGAATPGGVSNDLDALLNQYAPLGSD